MNNSPKLQLVKVRLSIPVLAKSRCPHCHSLPNAYYVLSNGLVDLSPRNIITVFEWFKNNHMIVKTSHYMGESPRHFTSTYDFNHKTNYKGFKAKMHRILKDTKGKFSNVSEFLMCDCGRSNWTFTDKSIALRPDISNRKSSRYFPHRFPY